MTPKELAQSIRKGHTMIREDDRWDSCACGHVASAPAPVKRQKKGVANES